MNADKIKKKETKKKLIEYKKTLIEYINKFNKSEKLSDFKDVRRIYGGYKDIGSFEKSKDIGSLAYQDFFTKVKKLIVLYNYTGNLYKFSLNLVVKNDCFFDEEMEFFDEQWDFFDKKIDFLKLSLKDMSNLLSLFIFQRFTKILGTEIIFFSLKNIKYKKDNVYFTYEGYFVVSEWYSQTEKKKIITSIYSIISNINSFFDDIKFNFKEINIKDFEKSFKKSSKNWKVDFIYWFFLSKPYYRYELKSDSSNLLDNCNLLDHISQKECRFNIIYRGTSKTWSIGKSIIEQWDNFLSNYLTDYNSLKKSALIFNILDEGFSNELEKIYLKYSTRLSCLDVYYGCSYKNDYKSHYFIKMYIIYFTQNGLCIGWNGIYKFNEMTKKYNYYCSFYKMYKNKYYIKRCINEIYNFNYLDEKYTNFTWIDFLKCRKELPRINFYSSMSSGIIPLFLNIKNTFYYYYYDYYCYKKKKKVMEEDEKNESLSFAKNPLKAIKFYILFYYETYQFNKNVKKKKKRIKKNTGTIWK